MWKRVSRQLLIWCLILATGLSSIPAVSATPMDHPNTYKNTGNMRADLIGVALTQVGYYEGPNNDTKYGVWYGWNNLGWCGMFVSWCAEQAGIPKSIIPKTGTTNPSDYNAKCYSGTEYRPQPGDLFFRKSGGGYAHVGIVYYLDGDYFYTIEGNTYWQGPEGVYIRSRKISDYDFGVPNYPDGAKHSYQAGYEATHPHREYYKCSHCGDQYYTGKTTVVSSCSDCKVANCSHSYNSWTSAGTSQHYRTCSKCGKKDFANHSWNTGTIIKQPSCSSTGENKQTCTVCSATRTSSIPALTTHNFGPWKYQDDDKQMRSCMDCAKKETTEHSIGEQWDTDALSHWYACEDCKGRILEEAHDFGDACDTPCQVCGFLRENGHRYSEEWQTDASGHWHACQACQSVSESAAHIYENSCDGICDSCGYDRHVDHVFPAHAQGDANGHWQECTKCGLITERQAHQPGDAATEAKPQTCTVCNWQLAPRLTHTHNYHMAAANLVFHSSKCDCGAELEHQAHSFDQATFRCSDCGFALQSTMPTMILVGAIPLLAIATALPLLFRPKRGRRYRY